MIYILDHYYLIDHKKYCLIIELDKDIEEMIELCAAIEFFFEDTVGMAFTLDERCLLKILTQYYGAKDIKSLFSEDALSQIKLPIEGIYELLDVGYDDLIVLDGYIVDLYAARETQCGPNYKDLITKWLPQDKQLEDIKRLLYAEGKDL